jgi:hypothetical protein
MTLGQYTPQLTPENYRQLNMLVLDAELLKRIAGIRSADDGEAVLRTIDTAQNQSTLSAARATELRTFILVKEGERLATEQSPTVAIAYTEAAIARYGKNTRLEEALRVHRSNRVADLHNNFAAMFNSRDYESAYHFIQAALTEFPGNRQLTSDMNLAEQALQRRR